MRSLLIQSGSKKTWLGMLLVAGILLFSGCHHERSSVAINKNSYKAYSVNDSITQGVNLSYVFNAPAPGSWEVELVEAYFDTIKQAGFRSVRIPVQWSAHTQSRPPHYIKSTFLDAVEEAVSWALEREMAAIIAFSSYHEFFLDPQKEEQRFYAIWEQVANRFSDYPESLLFELLIRPSGTITPESWNRYTERVIHEIRKTNPNRTLIVSPLFLDNRYELEALTLPEKEQNLIVGIGFYEPFRFTHQGTNWVGAPADEWLGTEWNGTEEEKQVISDYFEKIHLWSVENRRPVALTEFGSFFLAPNDSRRRWTNHVREAVEEKEISWIFQDFGSGFGIYNWHIDQWNEPVLDALIPVDTEVNTISSNP